MPTAAIDKEVRNMPRYNSEEMIRQYGFLKGLELLNALTARDLGMIDEGQLRRYLHQNISFFFGRSFSPRIPLG
jgi:hypothetical protein